MAALRILYVDDEPDLLELGRIFLEREGHFIVDTIESAPAALALLKSTKYDAIISDYLMPDMDGIEFLKKVRVSGNHIPFILFTGRGREEVVIQALNEGADFYLQKGGDPIPQFMELSHKVRQAVQRRLAEGQLLESQVQLRTIVDSIHVGIVTIDAETHTVLNANKKAIEMIGTDADEIIGKVCHTFICPAEVGRCPVTDLGQQVDLSERVLLSTKEGAIPILKSVVPTILDGKNVLIESFFDISERKQSEETFQTLIRSMVGKTGLESLDNITANVSRWLGTDIALILEITPDKKHGRILSRQPGSGKIPDDLIPIAGTPCGLAIEKGYYICPDNLADLFPGFTMPFGFTVRGYVGLALHNSAGNIIGAICTFSKEPLNAPPRLQQIFEIIGVKAAAEIERKQTEEVLRQSQERFRVLLENVPGVAIQGYHMDGTTFFWDQGSEKTYGYTAEEAVGTSLLDLIIPPEMQEDVKGAIAYMAQTGDPIPASELSLMKKDGGRVPVFSSHIILRMPQGGMELYCLDIDLSERKQTEETIQKIGREWQATFDAISDIVFLSDGRGRIIRHNRAFETFTGRSAEEIDGRNCCEVLKGTSTPMVGCPSGQARISRKRESTELNIGERWFVATVDPIFDATGEISSAVHILTDITDRRRDEEVLRQSEEKFRSIVETSPDMIWEVDEQGKFRYVSPIIESIIGYTPEEVLQKSILDLVPDEKKEATLQVLGQMISSEKSLAPVEVPARHRDGRDLILEIRPSRLIGPGGKLAGLRGVTVDITSRRRMENLLRDNLERYQLILKNANEGIMVNELTPEGPGKFLETNESACQILGMTSAELQNLSLADLDTPDMKKRYPEIVRELQQNRHSTFQTGYRTRDNTTKIIEISVSLFEIGGHPTLLSVIRDITEQKKAQQALLLANRQLNLLSGITRHDILNKISVIHGFLKVAGMKSADPALAEPLQKIHDATTAIRSQIEFTRIYHDLGTHEPQWIDLDTVIPRGLVPDAIFLSTDVKGLKLFADPMLEKVFSNLLDNSVRHGERVSRIAVSAHHSGEDLVVVWEDNGAGIAENDKERIFERGFGKNTGLGMFLAREVLSLTGITIAETGEPGAGARFEIRVPKGMFRVAAE